MTAPINRLEAEEAVAWRMVPVEPTIQMMNEGWRELSANQGYTQDDLNGIELSPVFSAMLAASPTPPAVSVEEVAQIISPSIFRQNLSRKDGSPTGSLKYPEQESARMRALAKATRIIELFKGKA